MESKAKGLALEERKVDFFGWIEKEHEREERNRMRV